MTGEESKIEADRQRVDRLISSGTKVNNTLGPSFKASRTYGLSHTFDRDQSLEESHLLDEPVPLPDQNQVYGIPPSNLIYHNLLSVLEADDVTPALFLKRAAFLAYCFDHLDPLAQNVASHLWRQELDLRTLYNPINGVRMDSPLNKLRITCIKPGKVKHKKLHKKIPDLKHSAKAHHKLLVKSFRVLSEACRKKQKKKDKKKRNPVLSKSKADN